MSRHHYFVRARLLERGRTISAVARDLKVTPSAISHVLSGRRRSRKIERRISQLLGLRRDDLFPRIDQPAERSQTVTLAA